MGGKRNTSKRSDVQTFGEVTLGSMYVILYEMLTWTWCDTDRISKHSST